MDGWKMNFLLGFGLFSVKKLGALLLEGLRSLIIAGRKSLEP